MPRSWQDTTDKRDKKKYVDRRKPKELDGISDADIAELNIPTGIPLLYRLNAEMKPSEPARYLDPEAAKIAMEAVANQGKTK